jgi:hypothetical protein
MLNLFLLCGCSSDSSTTASTLPVVVFSDVHFNPFDDESLFTELVSADASTWATVFKKSQNPPSALGSDTNYALLALALSSINKNLGASPLIMYTGDILGHNFATTFYKLYHANLGVPVPESEDIAKDRVAVAAMETFADNTVTFFMDQVRSSVGNLPVMFAIGNSDSYSGVLPEPSFLSHTAELYYSKFLNGVTDRQMFLDTFKKGGYYSVELPGTNLMVISLNTVFCTLPGNAQILDDELAWLNVKLASAESAGKKVWLLMHVPPGADITQTANLADSISGHIDSLANAKMMWQQQYNFQAGFLKTLSNHPGVVTMTLAAHTHMDEFRILTPSDVLEITPAITPYFGNYPAFKVFTFSVDTLKPTDYRSLNYGLAVPGQFNTYYTFSAAYAMHGYLNDSLALLYPALVTDVAKQLRYRGQYYSGNTAEPPAKTKHFQITNTTWPVFWSGIGSMSQQELFNNVNSY